MVPGILLAGYIAVEVLILWRDSHIPTPIGIVDFLHKEAKVRGQGFRYVSWLLKKTMPMWSNYYGIQALVRHGKTHYRRG